MYYIVINPASRSGRGLKIWEEQVKPVLRSEKIPYSARFSRESGDVSRIVGEILALQAGQPVSLIILGGDGTVNEALQAIPETALVTLGYIPTGSGNDLARDLGIPSSPAEALDLILHTGTVCPMDLGTILYSDGQRRRFCISCGIGYDAAVCEEVQRSRIKAVLNRLGLGKLIYLGVALKQLFATKAISGHLTLDDGEPIDIGSVLFVTGMIHRYEGGGFKFCPDADDADGLLDLCAVGNIPKPLALLALPTAFKGKHYRFKEITPYRAKRFTIETSAPLWVHTDGEVARMSDCLTVTCEQHAIHMIRPKGKP